MLFSLPWFHSFRFSHSYLGAARCRYEDVKSKSGSNKSCLPTSWWMHSFTFSQVCDWTVFLHVLIESIHVYEAQHNYCIKTWPKLLRYMTFAKCLIVFMCIILWISLIKGALHSFYTSRCLSCKLQIYCSIQASVNVHQAAKLWNTLWKKHIIQTAR